MKRNEYRGPIPTHRDYLKWWEQIKKAQGEWLPKDQFEKLTGRLGKRDWFQDLFKKRR
jgi:hypothetical protein